MFVTVNGARLYFDVEGSGLVPDAAAMRPKPTLVLLHGGPGADHSVYRPGFSRLADFAQIIYYDHRGNGRSEMCTPDTWNLGQWGDDVAGLCDALGIEKPIVLGTSFGGFVAQAYATRHPGHASKLILISTAARMDFDVVYQAFGRLGGEKARAVAQSYWSAPDADKRALYRDLCVPHYQVNKDGLAQMLARMIIRDETALWFNGPGNEHGRMDFRADLRKITCPVLVLAGERDPITPIQFSEEIVHHLPDGHVTFQRFADCGHGVTGDCPEAAFRAIRRFITVDHAGKTMLDARADAS